MHIIYYQVFVIFLKRSTGFYFYLSKFHLSFMFLTNIECFCYIIFFFSYIKFYRLSPMFLSDIKCCFHFCHRSIVFYYYFKYRLPVIFISQNIDLLLYFAVKISRVFYFFSQNIKDLLFFLSNSNYFLLFCQISTFKRVSIILFSVWYLSVFFLSQVDCFLKLFFKYLLSVIFICQIIKFFLIFSVK